MAKTVHFPAQFDDALAPGIIRQYRARVSVRRRWDDEWAYMPQWYPLEVTWSVSPTLPVAAIEMDYGMIRHAYRHLDADGEEVSGFSNVLKSEATAFVGSFIRIECPTLLSEAAPYETSRNWYGVIEEAHDEQGAADQKVGRTFGKVTLVAYGIEKLLADHQILTSTCQGFVEVGVPFDFNRAGPKGVDGNRSPDRLGTYLFATHPSTAQKWSSRQIIDYLLYYQVPKDESGAPKLRWTLDAAASLFVSDDDAPILKSDSATTYSLLSQLLDRRRGVVWWAEVDEKAGFVLIKANSINETAVIGKKLTIPANSSQLDVEYDTDPLTNAVINSSDLPRYHQVLVRGPRIRCVATFSDADGTLEPAWETADETEYEAGGSPHPENTPIKRKQIRNDAARRAPKLSRVYSVFRIPEDWDGGVGDGAGGEASWLFLDSEGERVDQCYMQLAIEQTMPIIEGENYEGTKIPAGAVSLPVVNEEEMRPIVFFKRPITADPPKYQPAEGMVGDVERTNVRENERIQCHVSVPKDTMTIRIDVQGQPQHAIAWSDFTPLEEDRNAGRFDWRDAVFTCSILSQVHVEARWPDPPYSGDAVRVKYLYGGDNYYQHYVAPGTVIGIDEDGHLIRSDGGWIPTLADPLDPLPFLEDIARIAGAWYTEHHYLMSLESYRLKPASDIPLAALILNAGGGPDRVGHRMKVNAPVTQIKFVYPRGDGDRCPPARMQIKTWAGELDAVEFAPVKPPPPPAAKVPGRSRPIMRSHSGEILSSGAGGRP